MTSQKSFQRGSEKYFEFTRQNVFKEKGHTKRTSMLVVSYANTEPCGQTDLARLGPAALSQEGQWALSTHAPVESRQPSHLPAWQDPDDVVGLVPFNANCTVVKIRLCFLQQRKHRWVCFPSLNSCKHVHNKPKKSLPGARLSTASVPVFLINNLLYIGLISVPSNLPLWFPGSTARTVVRKSLFNVPLLILLLIIIKGEK